MDGTSEYYRRNAAAFFNATANVDLTALRERFIARVPEGGLILDAGCGSGRDAKAFRERGFRVVAFDACPELTQLAAAHAGIAVTTRTFNDVQEEHCYDGLWACASLLHVPAPKMPSVLGRLWRSLKPGGAMYVSFKHGSGERSVDGRHFTDADEQRLRAWLATLPGTVGIEIWESDDQRPGRADRWINAIVGREVVAPEKLVTGGARHFLPHLCEGISRADEIDLAVAFIKTTGLRLLLPDLLSSLSRSEPRRPPRVRILTSDYLDITDPEALRLLMLLQQQGAQIRVYESAGSSFHLKAYLFARYEVDGSLRGQAFIGSSNISRQALQEGLEWNYKVEYPGDAGFLEAWNRFEELFADPRTVSLSDAWIDSYEARRVTPTKPMEPGSTEAEPPPKPTQVQQEALAALERTRLEGYRRGLVVMATGLGKTWLAAFDSAQCRAARVLFVAHREEILTQAAATFLRIRPHGSVGYYMGQMRDEKVDVLCASVQTLSRSTHLERFDRDHFDYVVIDEFHHAAAATYRRLLSHFEPRFLLGLTATPDRTDQSDILSLCDDNLVFNFPLFDGVKEGLLSPFHYFGIFDRDVDYREIPWRNGRFDPDQLSHKLATLARARHALREWREHAQERTLAFCVSIRHAEFMAEQFKRAGVAAAAVHGESTMSRGEALQKLRTGSLEVVFSVDLFSEGVDLPEIDTVMMLRPTESKVLFLQQLGRGLRRAEGKDHLVVLDFIGNHTAFLHKPQALFGVGPTYRELSAFARKVEARKLELPEGCYLNYDLELINFLKSLDAAGTENDYAALKEVLGRRPTLLEFYRADGNVQQVRQRFGGWFDFVRDREDLETDPQPEAAGFLRELEKTPMTKSYKMVLLEAFQELDGWLAGVPLASLAERSWEVLQRRRQLLADLPQELLSLQDGSATEWRKYWQGNPVNAWTGRNVQNARPFFRIREERFAPAFSIAEESIPGFTQLVQEVVDYRLATYASRRSAEAKSENVIPINPQERYGVELPYFPNLGIACGHFRTGTIDAEEHRRLGDGYGRLDPAKHFIARATGRSMDGGKNPIRDGDHLLLERVTPSSAGSITGSVMVVERQDVAGDSQYLLRHVVKGPDGSYILRANNPAYPDLTATDEFRTLARLRAVLAPWEMMIGESMAREEIPALFGETFNPGNWNLGHVVLNEQKTHVLLVTLNKRGRAQDHRYLDHWIDDSTFHWQSQNQTSPRDKREDEIIRHKELGISIHLFVQEEKPEDGKASPFVYHGPVEYGSHRGEKPMSAIFSVPFGRM